MHLYGKDLLKQRLDGIAAEHRMPHAVLLYGERGSGRRVMANYVAKLQLCSAPPCENCAVCRKINADAHPDVIFPKRESDGKYNMDALRNVITGMAVRPNDGDIKVYIFEDFDQTTPQFQNTLLKIIEEPADYLRFVFTCENMNQVLETIISRVTEFEVPTPSVTECAQALIDGGTAPAQAKELAALFTGNIGKCLSLLNDGAETKLMDTARKAADGIARKSRYITASALSAQSARADYAGVLEYLTGILRDALVKQCGGELTSCGKKEAAGIAASYSAQRIAEMLDILLEVSSHGILNLNLALSASYLSSKLIY